MKITGQILKENRERKGVTLSEVSLSTKITIKTLVAIEEGDPINLPPKTFLRGFVRSYAVFLGVDVEEILRTFHEEMGSTLSRPAAQGTVPSELNAAATEATQANHATGLPSDVTEKSEKPNPPVERRASKRKDAEATLRDEPSLVTKGGIVGGILLLIILIVFLKGKMDSYESERTTPSSSELANNELLGDTQSSVTDLNSPGSADAVGRDGGGKDDTNLEPNAASPNATGGPPSPTPTAAAVAVVVSTPTPTPMPTPTPTATPKPTSSPTATPTPTATPKPTPSPTATPRATPSPAPSATPAPAASPSATPKPLGAAPAGKSHEILIEALDQVDIEVTADGESAKKFQLRGDQVQSIKVKRKATLKISDGGAVNIIVNGIDRGVPGDLGKPTRVELP